MLWLAIQLVDTGNREESSQLRKDAFHFQRFCSLCNHVRPDPIMLLSAPTFSAIKLLCTRRDGKFEILAREWLKLSKAIHMGDAMVCGSSRTRD